MIPSMSKRGTSTHLEIWRAQPRLLPQISCMALHGPYLSYLPLSTAEKLVHMC